MKKVVITGAPHSGKSAVVMELLNTGKIIVPETAIQVIDSLHELLGPEQAHSWREDNFDSFQNLILARQFYMEEKIINYALNADFREDVVFLDRGVFDSIAFSRHYNFWHNYDNEYIDNTYGQAFVLELVLPFKEKEGTGRIETENDCIALQQHLIDVYTEVGLEPIMVPLMSVEDRVEFILDRIIK